MLVSDTVEALPEVSKMVDGEIVDDHTVVGRALAVLEAVAECGVDATLAEVARLTGIPKPTALRVANNLVSRGLLCRSGHGYALGAELSRLGDKARLQQAYSRYTPVLEELHAAHGGVAWLIAGRDVVDLQRVGMVCDNGFAATARSLWPAQGAASTLINTAGGHVILGRRPDLLEMVAQGGMAPVTPHSMQEVRHLSARGHRARQDGVAVESEESLQGWTCAAALLLSANGQLGVIGATVPVVRANSRQILRSLIRALDAIAADVKPTSRSATVARGGIKPI